MLTRVFSLLGVSVLAVGALCAQTPAAKAEAKPAVKYGANPAAGKTFTHDGVTLYYEVYGAGQPLLLVHGNGGSIGDLTAQIEYFRKRYKVIAMDSRDHGRSSDSAEKITYEKMTDDLAALLDHLHTGPANVLGWSDGGIEALLLGVRHPAKVRKLAAMAANLEPSTSAVYQEVFDMVHTMLNGVPAAERETAAGKRELKVGQLVLDEPHIDAKSLEAITAPTLVLAGDHDLIRDEHTLEIYHHIPNSQLCIFPDATHMIPYDDRRASTARWSDFFRMPFVKKDRVKDMLQSYEKMKASEK